MPLTPSTLTRHEVIGLDVTVDTATNPDLAGIAGVVVNETKNMLHIETDTDDVKRVPKQGATFEFVLPTGDRVMVDGRRLIARPARRTEATGGTTWHSD